MALLNFSEDNISNGYYISRNWNDFDYYYIKAAFNNNLNIPASIIKDNCLIIVNFEFEPYKEIVDKIYIDLISTHNIEPSRIILISENADLTEHINITAKKFNSKCINYEWSNIAELSIRLQVLMQKNTFIENKLDQTPAKIFLSFNRRWRLHRPLFVSLCYAKKILHNGYVSLGTSDDYQTWNSVLPQLYELIAHDINLLNELKSVEQEIISLPNLYLDTGNLIAPRHRIHQDDIDPNVTDSFYKNSLLSIISETLFFENQGRFFSEKTFKPIAYKHPFIFMGAPNSLDLLRELGYKTYHPFIDESYDKEIDSILRIKLIVRELERLCNMSKDQILAFKTNTMRIAKYNYNHLLMRNKFYFKKI